MYLYVYPILIAISFALSDSASGDQYTNLVGAQLKPHQLAAMENQWDFEVAPPSQWKAHIFNQIRLIENHSLYLMRLLIASNPKDILKHRVPRDPTFRLLETIVWFSRQILARGHYPMHDMVFPAYNSTEDIHAQMLFTNCNIDERYTAQLTFSELGLHNQDGTFQEGWHQLQELFRGLKQLQNLPFVDSSLDCRTIDTSFLD